MLCDTQTLPACIVMEKLFKLIKYVLCTEPFTQCRYLLKMRRSKTLLMKRIKE